MEIEVKYRISKATSLALFERIKELGGKFLEDSFESDTYFNVSGRNSFQSKECLRIRKSHDGKNEITYKPPTEIDDVKRYFAKKETNLTIDDPEAATNLLLSLGNTILVVVEKSRKYFSLEKCTVCIDQITALGEFLEIEFEGQDTEIGLTEIHKCAKMLGLDDSDIVTQPYRDLVMISRQTLS